MSKERKLKKNIFNLLTITIVNLCMLMLSILKDSLFLASIMCTSVCGSMCGCVHVSVGAEEVRNLASPWSWSLLKWKRGPKHRFSAGAAHAVGCSCSLPRCRVSSIPHGSVLNKKERLNCFVLHSAALTESRDCHVSCGLQSALTWAVPCSCGRE